MFQKLDNEQDHDVFLSKLTSALCCENFSRLPLNSSLGRLPLSGMRFVRTLHQRLECRYYLY